MSADLFAEFANSNPPPQQQQPPPPVSSAATDQQNNPVAKAPFSFGFNDFTTATASPIEQWPSIASQPSGTGSWATGPALSLPQTTPASQALNDVDDDGWGDFETAQPTPAVSTFGQPSDPFGAFSAPPKEPEIRNRPVRAPTIDIMTNTLVDIQPKLDWNSKPKPEESSSSWNAVQSPPRYSMKSTPRDPNVLFDADDFELQAPEVDEDEDDFGDFEAVAPAPMQPKQSATSMSASPVNPAPLLDLLSLDDPPVQQPAKKSTQKQPPPQLLGALSFGAASSTLPNPPKSPSFQERNPFPDLEIKTNVTAVEAAKKKRDVPKSRTPVTAWPAVNRGAKSSGAKKFDDDWDAWDDTPNVAGNAKDDVPGTDQAESWDWGAGDGESDAIKGSDDDPPPTNVPPPSVILSAFPSLFSSASVFFKPISGHSASIKQQVLSNPKAIHFLQGYILLAATAARVIAGRKHRWHRDKILAKSMSISAAGSKGMKLAGVDKTQSAREDREAADVVAVWREYVGRLRSAVAATNAEGKLSLRVPELSENMLVQTAKMVPTGPKPCIICGLKREERVSKVDYDVEDSFGEWWVEHWGHRACKNFWVEHEQKLRQR
ncbi:serine threonine- kinase ppk6 [Trichoderma arundinaceum]|uniref:Serine threonine-kinase ppk6 n=1 Tax=Trichoderma arundinaceum TaxID=490622 RepID=A0A395NVU3_TRIAR|nr:serine threonine- kinase ppk6 [Trichoderma arundinaceum]